MSRFGIPVRVGAAGLALLAGWSFHAVGDHFYARFWIPQGLGVHLVLIHELAHIALFTLFGLVTFAALSRALDGLGPGGAGWQRLRRIAHRGSAGVVPAALLISVVGWAIGRFVLEGAVLLDDEHVYRFIAQTLGDGSLRAPSPGGDLGFYREPYVVLTESARYGKYPIGHPLLLALGGLLDAERLVVPVVSALCALPLYAAGARAVGRPRAALAVALFALSPQLLLTSATLLSQPASALALLSGVACLFAAEGSRRAASWLFAAAAAFGFGVLVRPLPGALFVVVALVYVATVHRPWGRRPRAAWRPLLAFALPLFCGAALLAAINRFQNGDALTTGYEASDLPGLGLAALFAPSSLEAYALSIAGHLLRQNVWLFGWPLSLALCLFARRTPRTALIWGLIGAAWTYRLLAPKAGVAATGPLYLFETLPLLALLSADGLGELVARGRLGADPAVARRRALSLLVAATTVGVGLFLPTKLLNLRRMAEAQLVLPRMLEARGIHNALVFHQQSVPQETRLSWAFNPRINSPRLDDDVLFVRYLGGRDDTDLNLDFWRRRHPDRSAWYFTWNDRDPRLVRLESFAARVAR